MEDIGRGKWIERFNPTGFISGADNVENTFAGQNDEKEYYMGNGFLCFFWKDLYGSKPDNREPVKRDEL